MMKKNKKLWFKQKRYFKKRSKDAPAVRIKTETNKAGIFKKLTVAFLVLVQLSVLVLIHIYFAVVSNWVLLLNLTLSFITSVYVLSSNKNGLSKAVWIMFLLMFFAFSNLIFWLSEDRVFFGKVKKRYKAVFDQAQSFNNNTENYDNSSITVQNDCRYLNSVGRFSTYDDSKINYFSSGTLLFDDVLESIKKAKKFVFIEFFIVSDGVLLKRFYDILSQKVAEGVDVRLIYDDLGSKGTLSYRTKRKFKKAGIKIKAFNKFMPFFLVSMNYRDHRKIISVDGQTAYTGGSNLADEYINEKRMHGYWKDTGVKITGRAVDGFTLIFLRQWEVMCREREDYSAFMNLYQPIKNKSAVVPYADGLDYEHAIGRGVYEKIIAGANEFVYIMTPYFIIDNGLTDLIINKALSGVDVRLVLPDVPDKQYVYDVSRNNAEKLIGYGVKVYTVTNAFVHSKIVISENCVSVGSVNMDLRSFYQQFECAVYTDDEKFMKQVLDDFDDTFKFSVLIDDKNKRRNNIVYRTWVGLLNLFAPLM